MEMKMAHQEDKRYLLCANPLSVVLSHSPARADPAPPITPPPPPPYPPPSDRSAFIRCPRLDRVSLYPRTPLSYISPPMYYSQHSATTRSSRAYTPPKRPTGSEIMIVSWGNMCLHSGPTISYTTDRDDTARQSGDRPSRSRRMSTGTEEE
jgi:hypothetical protein